MIKKIAIAIGVVLSLTLSTPALSSKTTGERGELIYFVMLDRFANGDSTNDDGGLGTNYKVSGLLRSNNGFYHGGDLVGLREQIPYIKSLGFTAIWITPVVRQVAVAPDGNSSAYHGYWGAGFDQVDPHLGTMAEFKNFVDSAHESDLKVILDIVTNHSSDTIRYLEGNLYRSLAERPYRDNKGRLIDLQKLTQSKKSPVLDVNRSFGKTPQVYRSEKSVKSPTWLNDVTNYHNRGDSTFEGESSHLGDFFGLDDLFTEKPEVVDGFIDIYSNWITETGIDGFRIDTVKHVNVEFWRKFLPAMRQAAVKSGKNEFPMWAEVFDADPGATSYWVREGAFTEVLDFPFQKRVVDFVKDRTAMPLASMFNSDDYYLRSNVDVNRLGTFLGNHDMGRIGSFVSLDRGPQVALRQNQLAHALLYLLRGTPIVYYGDEFGLMGGNDKDARQDLFVTEVEKWQKESRIGQNPIGTKSSFETTNPMQSTLRTLAKLRTENRALTFGSQEILHAASGVLAISRQDYLGGKDFMIVFNTNDDETTLDLTRANQIRWSRIAGEGVIIPESETLKITLPGISWGVFRSEESAVSTVKSLSVTRLRSDPLDSKRFEIAARVEGVGAHKITFFYQNKKGDWLEIGSDLSPTFSRNPPDNGLYRVFPAKADLNVGKALSIKAVAITNGQETTSTARTLVLRK